MFPAILASMSLYIFFLQFYCETTGTDTCDSESMHDNVGNRETTGTDTCDSESMHDNVGSRQCIEWTLMFSQDALCYLNQTHSVGSTLQGSTILWLTCAARVHGNFTDTPRPRNYQYCSAIIAEFHTAQFTTTVISTLPTDAQVLAVRRFGSIR
jgi:hypothetical protein